MASKNITITSVSSIDGIPTVVGTAGEVPFTATRLQWGGKVLMHVASRDLDRGTRIAVGHAAKKAVREAGLDLTPAPLKRPRKEAADLTVTVKVEGPADPVPLDLVVDTTPAPVEDLTTLTVPQLKSRAKDRGLKSSWNMNRSELLAALS
jgi:hypothetical protein